MSAVRKFRPKPGSGEKWTCSGCGESTDAPCLCGPEVQILREQEAERREDQRQRKQKSREKAKQNQQSRHVTDSNVVPFDAGQSAETRNAAYAAEEQEPTPPKSADQHDLTSEQQDQILHLMLKLLASVDHQHRRKFFKHLTCSSADGVYLPSCSARGWANGGYAVDAAFLGRVAKANIGNCFHVACQVAPATAAPVEAIPVAAPPIVVEAEPVIEPEQEPITPSVPPKRKRRTKAEIAADETRQRAITQDIIDGMVGDACVIAYRHGQIDEAIKDNPSASDEQLAKRFGVAPRTVAFVRKNGPPMACGTAAKIEPADDPGIPDFLRRTQTGAA
jgi:hypothetical protein